MERYTKEQRVIIVKMHLCVFSKHKTLRSCWDTPHKIRPEDCWLYWMQMQGFIIIIIIILLLLLLLLLLLSMSSSLLLLLLLN